MQAATGPGGVKVRKRDKVDIFQDLVSAERGILAYAACDQDNEDFSSERPEGRLMFENINQPDDLDFYFFDF